MTNYRIQPGCHNCAHKLGRWDVLRCGFAIRDLPMQENSKGYLRQPEVEREGICDHHEKRDETKGDSK